MSFSGCEQVDRQATEHLQQELTGIAYLPLADHAIGKNKPPGTFIPGGCVCDARGDC
jgi:hypothetical protein